MGPEFVSVLGLPFIRTTRRDFVHLLQNRIEQKERTFVVTANPEIVMYSLQNTAYKATLEKADYITADGIGVVKAAQLSGNPVPERVSGFDMMMDLLELANRKSYRVFLLGATQPVVEKATRTVKERFPDIDVVGAENGYFDWRDPGVANRIQSVKADLVFVALGCPLQEKWIGENIGSFDQGIFMGVGGSFDVLAGNVKRAPEKWQKMNLEWFYRLMQEPSRWRRLTHLPKFAAIVIVNKLRKKL